MRLASFLLSRHSASTGRRAGSSLLRDGATLAVVLANSNILEWARVVSSKKNGTAR